MRLSGDTSSPSALDFEFNPCDPGMSDPGKKEIHRVALILSTEEYTIELLLDSPHLASWGKPPIHPDNVFWCQNK